MEVQLGRALPGPPALLGEDGEEECGEVRAARKFLEKFDPQYQQLNEKMKKRTVELQEQAEVFAQVSCRRSGVIRNEFHPRSLRGVWAVTFGGGLL